MERWYKTLKGECIRIKTPLTLEDARRIVADFVAYYNEVRLHSAIGYVTPADKLAGRDPVIFAERDRKLEAARERRTAAAAGGSEPRRAVARLARGPDDGRRPGRRIGLRGDTTRAPTQGPRPKGGGTMPPCLSPSGLARRRQIDPTCSSVHSTLSPDPGFSISR